MDVLRLRILTKKSRLNFGRFATHTIQDLLNIKSTSYLRWVYYNASRISFIPEILREIHVLEKDEIEKPGKNPEYGKMLNKKFNDGKKKYVEIDTKGIRGRTDRSRITKSGIRSKRFWQSKNQGHTK